MEQGSKLGSVREWFAEAIRYWEPLRLLYNGLLFMVVAIYFVKDLPASRALLNLDGFSMLFILALGANVAYCAAYPVDLVVQSSGLRAEWRRLRWILFGAGAILGAILARWLTLTLLLGNHVVGS